MSAGYGGRSHDTTLTNEEQFHLQQAATVGCFCMENMIAARLIGAPFLLSKLISPKIYYSKHKHVGLYDIHKVRASVNSALFISNTRFKGFTTGDG